MPYISPQHLFERDCNNFGLEDRVHPFSLKMVNEDGKQDLANTTSASTELQDDYVGLGNVVKAEQLHAEDVNAGENPIYDNAEEEPELHARTYIALTSMVVLNFVQVFALQGPPAVVCP